MGIYDREYYRGESRMPGFFSTAPVCKSIILINIGVFLAGEFGIVDRDKMFEWLGATSSGIFEHGHVWQLVTATFVHANHIHLIFNMLFFWFAGSEIEAMYGPRDFLGLYLSAGVVSTLVWALFDLFAPFHHGMMIGASGAIWSVFVLFALFFPRREILFMFVIPVEVWLLAVIFFAYDLYNLLQRSQADTAFASHVAGAVYGYLFRRFDLRFSHVAGMWRRARRPRLRVVMPETRESPARGGMGSSWAPNSASAAKPSSTSTTSTMVSEDQLAVRLDEILAKIAREGRGNLTEEENRILQEASQRARLRRSDRL